MSVVTWGPLAGTDIPQDQMLEYVTQYPKPPGERFQESVADKTRTFADYWEKRLAERSAANQNAQVSEFNTINQDAARRAQQAVIQNLQMQANGGLSQDLQKQLSQNYAQNNALQSSIGSTARGTSAGATMRGVQAGQEQNKRSMVGDQQMALLQQQQAATQLLNQALAQQRGQDFDLATNQANATLEDQKRAAAMRQFYDSLGLSFGLERADQFAREKLADVGLQSAYSQMYADLVNTGIEAAATGAQQASRYTSNPDRQNSSDPEAYDAIESAFNGEDY